MKRYGTVEHSYGDGNSSIEIRELNDGEFIRYADYEEEKLKVEDLKCCGNCSYFDIIDNIGGVCNKNEDQRPCTRQAVCKDWRVDHV